MAEGGRFDRDDLMDRLDDDTELLGELFEDYLEDKQEHLEKVHAAVAGGDMKLLYDGAHALRGCVANFCANAAFEVATQLQDLAKAGQAAQAKDLAVRLDREIEALTKELRAFIQEKSAG